MANMKKFLYWIVFIFICAYSFAQDNSGKQIHEEVGGLRANGKIYVVVAVVITMLLGLLFYLLRLDKKITRLEKHYNR